MIGDGDFDHKWWGSAEVYMYKFELEGNGMERRSHGGYEKYDGA